MLLSNSALFFDQKAANAGQSTLVLQCQRHHGSRLIDQCEGGPGLCETHISLVKSFFVPARKDAQNSSALGFAE